VATERRELHRRIGLVFDTHNMYEQLSGRQNLEFFADLYRVDRARVDSMLELTEMKEPAGRRFKTYSKGMKQRMMLARALLPDPEVLFLDEPSAGLDPASARRVREVIGEVASRGKTVFLTTHSMELADTVCARLAIVDRGKVVSEGTPAELKRRHADPVIRVTRKDGTIEQLTMGGDETAKRMEELMGTDQVAEVATVQPTLEDVFLGLTGKKLT
jgi:ABC-2 type transport system ATP-binding protein